MQRTCIATASYSTSKGEKNGQPAADVFLNQKTSNKDTHTNTSSFVTDKSKRRNPSSSFDLEDESKERVLAHVTSMHWNIFFLGGVFFNGSITASVFTSSFSGLEESC